MIANVYLDLAREFSEDRISVILASGAKVEPQIQNPPDINAVVLAEIKNEPV